MEVVSLSRETPSLMNLKITPPVEEGRFDFQAGQFAKILCPDGRESYFAMASEPEEKRFIEFLIEDKPKSPAHSLSRLKSGDLLKISPPFGAGYPMERLKSKDVLLIGMGSGLSPLRSLLKSMLRRDQQFGKVMLLYGARTPHDIPYRGDFELWAKKINVEIAISQPGSHPWEGFIGRVTHRLPNLAIAGDKIAACICGTKAMEDEVRNLLERMGVSKDNILLNH